MVARATPNTRRPAEAIASMDCVSAARSAALEPAEAGDRFGRALGGDDEFLPIVVRLPDMRHGEQVGPKSVGV